MVGLSWLPKKEMHGKVTFQIWKIGPKFFLTNSKSFIVIANGRNWSSVNGSIRARNTSLAIDRWPNSRSDSNLIFCCAETNGWIWSDPFVWVFSGVSTSIELGLTSVASNWLKTLLMQIEAASLVSAVRSAPTKPGVFLAMWTKSKLPSNLSFFANTCKILAL